MNHMQRKIVLVLSCLLQAALITSVQAGGLYLNEFGTPSMGTAGAGAQAWADDASTSLHNPAGMTRIQGNQLMLTSGLFFSRVKFDTGPGTFFSGGDGGDAGGWAPLGGLFYVHSLSERWGIMNSSSWKIVCARKGTRF